MADTWGSSGQEFACSHDLRKAFDSDFRQAFDSVHRGILMKIISAYGILDKLVGFIERAYTDTLAKVMTPEWLTTAFKIFFEDTKIPLTWLPG